MKEVNQNRHTRRIRNMMWVVLLAISLSVGFGGYWVSQVIDQLGAKARKDTVVLLALSESVSSATLIFSRQTQEWKDMLLRAHDPDLFADHHRAMLQESAAMQIALQQAKRALQMQGLDTEGIASIEQKEQKLLFAYAAALRSAERTHPQYYRLVDEKVRGMDRALREELLTLQGKLLDEVKAKVTVLGEDGREQAVSSSFVQIGLLAVLLPLVALAAFFIGYRAIREIGRSDARIRTIYESIGDAVLVADTKGRVDTLNEVAQRLTGWSQLEAQGQALSQVFQLFDANTLQRVLSPAERVLGDGRAIPMSNGMILRRRDGSEVAIEDSAAPVPDENGKLSSVVMVFHDVSQRYAMIASLKQERALFMQTFDQAGVGMAQMNEAGYWTRVNHKLCEITGYSEAELLKMSFEEMIATEERAAEREALQALFSGELAVYAAEKRFLCKDGSAVWVELTVSVVRNEQGAVDYGISVIQDINARKDAELTAATSQAEYQALFEQMPEGVLLINENMQVVSHNLEAQRKLEYDSETLTTLHVWDIDVVDDPEAIEQRRRNILETGRDHFESRYRTQSGRVIDVDVSVQLVRLADGKPVFQTLFHDITEQKQVVDQIEHLAYHDQLTGLANRRLLQDRIDQAIGGAVRRNANIAVCYLDLDHFKDVNDTLGHQSGDMLLQQVSHRLQSCIRAEDTLARIGGDEFVVMLNDVMDTGVVADVAQKIIRAIGQPYMLGNEEMRVTPSIGISMCPQDSRDSDTLLKQADSAMYQAKESGRATYRFYTEELHQKALERLKIERLLRRAFEHNEFELHYQPQIDLQTGQVSGCEALIRWNHPGMGQVSPAQFIPVAEHSNLIIEIGDWVIREVCRQARIWQDQGRCIKVSFNVSARQFMRPGELLATLRGAIADSGVDAGMLELELTESLLLDPLGMSAILNDIRAMGLSLALDDFGTGYSSLSYLRRFPIQILKIDRSFVSDADHDANDAEMVRTIIGMAHNLTMTLVAEGVETEQQASLLKAQGCEVAQGYYFGRPLKVAAFEKFLAG